MAVIGYWRTSTGGVGGQDGERQIRALKKAGASVIYGDQITGVSAYGDRPELSKCLAELKAGDLFICEELSRLGRSMVEMLVQVNQLIERDVFLKTLDGRLDTSVMPEEIVRLIVGVLGYAAEMELKNIKTRTAEGRAVAQSRGVKFGRKKTYDEYQVAEIMEKRSQGQGYGTIARSLGMSRSMVQRIVQQEEVAAA